MIIKADKTYWCKIGGRWRPAVTVEPLGTKSWLVEYGLRERRRVPNKDIQQFIDLRAAISKAEGK